MLAEIVKIADELIVTSPQVLAKPGVDSAALANAATELGFSGSVRAFDQPGEGLDAALAAARPDDLVLVTGSLYLVGNVRGRWHPDDEIVAQRTPWPRGSGTTYDGEPLR